MNLSKHLTNEYLSRIKNLELKTRLVLQGAMTGWHSSPFHGYSTEFSQYRNYTPGDNLKYFDWKIYGKSEKAVVRQFQDETNANVYLVLDSSQSMDYAGGGEVNKLDYAIVIAASLALQAYKQRDAISLTCGSDFPQGPSQPRNSATNLKQVFSLLEKIPARGKTDLKRMLRQLAPRLKSGSMTYILTDLWQQTDDIITGLKSIRYKAQATTLIEILTPNEINFFNDRNVELIDMENQNRIKASLPHLKDRYLETLNDHRTSIRMECSRLKVKFVSLQTSFPYYQSMRKVLRSSGV
ncbi:DUF58 domain-containing protein [Fibrobacterota bacterium]